MHVYYDKRALGSESEGTLKAGRCTALCPFYLIFVRCFASAAVERDRAKFKIYKNKPSATLSTLFIPMIYFFD